jgi:hypothetical protein
MWRRSIDPLRWSIWLRRIFLLTLPLSLPLALIWFALLIIAIVVADLWAPISIFWNAPPKTRSNYSNYRSYHSDHSSRSLADQQLRAVDNHESGDTEPPREVEPLHLLRINDRN